MKRGKAAVSILSFALLLSVSSSLQAIDVAVHLLPELSVPTIPAGDSKAIFSTGFGMDLRGDLEFFGLADVYAEGGLRLNPIVGMPGKNFLFGSGGIGVGLFAYPIPRIKLRAAASGGAYVAYAADYGSSPGWYWKAGTEAGYRLSPGVSLLASASYGSWQSSFSSAEPFMQGYAFGLTLDISLSGSSGAGIHLEEIDTTPVFTANYSAYGKLAFAKIRITNGEPAELRNVKISFSAGSYSSDAALCLDLPYLARGESIEVPLYANLGPSVLAITENTKIQGELRIDYELLGKKMTTVKAKSASFLHRNALAWRDPEIVAGFVSPNDPAVLELSKYIAGLIRDKIKPDLDKSLQFGMGLFETLRLLGLKYAPDPSTPYSVFHADPAKIDYLQYPYQTLAYKGGDSDDLSVLYAALLESVGIEAAFIATDGELLTLFPLQMGEAQARTSFISPGDFIYRDGKAWLPIQLSRMREGFLLAWQGGAKLLKDSAYAMDARSEGNFIELASAWRRYQPIGLPGIDFRSAKPDEAQVNLAFENAMNRFVVTEVEPRAQRLISDMGGKGTGRQYNTLGILYAKYGLLREATDAFLKAVGMGYGPANTNLANVAFLLKDYVTAIKYFEASLALQPDNKAALIGLARAKYEIDAYADADELFSKVSALDPALAGRYAYLSSHVDVSTARASSAAADRGGVTAWDEGE